MYRVCQATGRLACRFDPATHRCKCGRWQRGFAPKKEPVKPRAECQICCGRQACNLDGTIVHHGYTRPGCGFIQGDCFGVNHQPFPATDALEAWLVAMCNYAERCRNELAALPTVPSLTYKYLPDKSYNLPARQRRTETVIVQRGEPESHIDASGTRIQGRSIWASMEQVPSFANLETAQRNRLERDIEQSVREQKRVAARIADGQRLREAAAATV